MIIGTAGHIDHGKTALVKAITGVDTDRLPEEKARGITIDIGFAHTQMEGTEVSFIDVPGHERFIKNMLAGIGGIDLLMLVVAADESVMPQTREHFDICRLLQIPSGVIVITKRDLVDPESLDVVREEISGLVKGSFLESAPVFSVSSKTGDGIPELKSGLARAFRDVRQRQTSGVLRLPIDRVFVLKGQGTVVTGTLISGVVQKESPAEILPSHRKVKIRSVHAHNHSVDKAVAGQRTALNLQGVEKADIRRGDVLTEPDFFEPTSLLDVRITLLQNSKPLLHNSAIRFHHLTNDVPARLTLLETGVLSTGESTFAQLRLQRPVFAINGDRFILRKHSPLVTIGGGIILDHMPSGRARRGEAQTLQRLQQLEQAAPEQRFAIAVESRGFQGAGESFLKAKLALHPLEIRNLKSDEVVFLRPNPVLAISRKSELEMIQHMENTVTLFHNQNPLLPGIPKEELRTRLRHEVLPEVFSAVLERACSADRLQAEKDTVSLFGRTVSLNQEQESLAALVEDFFLRVGLGSPGMDSVAKEIRKDAGSVRKMLFLLVRQGKLVKVADDYFVHHTNWEELKQRIRSLKPKQTTLSVPDFKALFGLSRKYAIPLLEQLDREGITRRSGNERIIS